MNKHQIIILVAVLLVVVGLSGCIDTESDTSKEKELNTEESKFVGTWITNVSGMSFNLTSVFFSDGTGSTHFGEMTWEIKDGKLVIHTPGVTTEVYEYLFTDNETKIHLTHLTGGIGDMTLTKK